ncbi:restriction endonuclease subunit S [Rubidibacter lacunae]|nr:restriction endonuclease subunit S [Rubidibacter lacunae]
MTPLGQLSKLVRGPFGGSLKKEIFVSTGYAVYEQQHAIYSDFRTFRYFITEEKFRELRRFAIAANDIIMSCSGTMGKFAIIPDGAADGVINQALLKLTPNGYCDIRFLKEVLELPSVQEKLLSQSAGGAIKNVVSVKQIKALPLRLPGTDEQQKIAECLSSVDMAIAAQARKLDALKTHKKGLMQQLFPREGETQPRLRFPEFRGKEEWEVKMLDELVDFQSGGTPSKANAEYWNGSVPWVSAKDMKQLFLADSEDHISASAVDNGAKLVPSGALLMLVRGMTLLKDVPICVLRREMSFNQDVKALRPKNNVDGLFLALLLTGNKNRLLEMVTIAGHGTGKLDTDELKTMVLTLPRSAEQQHIANCLSTLDDLINAATQKLEALKTHKRGLMQQLFPSPEEVKA